MIEFERAYPILNVRNVEDSIGYYVEKLGFVLDWDWGSPPTFASVGRGDVHIFLCENCQGVAGTWIYIPVGDVDALHKEYVERGAIIRQNPINFPWGSREMNVEDIDGHRLRLASDATGPSDGIALVVN